MATATAEVNDRIAQISLKERDRRYKAVRQAMAAEGLEALILPANHSRWDQSMADSRYLTCIGSFGTEVLTVFPLQGEVTAYLFNRSAWWKGQQDWIKDARDGRNNWAKNITERLKELKIKNGKVGLAGLGGITRVPDGLFSYNTVVQIQKAFPNVEFVETSIVQDIRAVKSPEEIGLLRHSMEIIEKMIAVLIDNSRPNVEEKHLFASMIRVMLDNDAELPSLLIFGTGPNRAGGSFVPTNRLVRTGDMVVGEIEARYAGYSGQAVHPIIIGGRSVQPTYTDLLKVSHECFERVAEKMKPGVTMGTLMDTYERTVKRASKGKAEWSHPLMHGRGLGDEVPALLGDADVKRFRNVPLKAGMSFIVKPRAIATRGGLSAQIGDTVVVTNKGGERLGKREMKLEVIH